jgi:hypothetical protein
MKRLRKAVFSVKLRYYAVGEYGRGLYRPHYHAIIFGLYCHDPPDLLYNRNSLLFNPALANKLIILGIQHRKLAEQAWQGKGFLHFGSVTSQSITYVTKYLCKTFDCDVRQEVAKRVLRPEFSLMSRCPGLGSGFIAKPECERVLRSLKMSSLTVIQSSCPDIMRTNYLPIILMSLKNIKLLLSLKLINKSLICTTNTGYLGAIRKSFKPYCEL